MNANAAVIEKWSLAYNLHDLDGLLECYGEAIANTQVPWGRTITGKEAMRMVYARTFAAFPDIAIRTREVICDRDRVVLRWDFSGTMQGEFAGAKPTGKRFAMEGCEVFRLADGRIVEQQGYWDKATMFAQLGIAP